MIYTILDSDIYFKLIDEKVAEELDTLIFNAKMLDIEVGIRTKTMTIWVKSQYSDNKYPSYYDVEGLYVGNDYFLIFDLAYDGHLKKITIWINDDHFIEFSFPKLREAIQTVNRSIAGEIEISR